MMVTAERTISSQQWTKIKSRLRNDLGEGVYSSWFARLDFEEAQEDVIHLSTPTRFIKQWLQEQYAETLLTTVQEEFKSCRQVRLSVRGSLRPKTEPQSATAELATTATNVTAARAQTAPNGAPVAAPRAAVATTAAKVTEGIAPDPRLTLDTFEEGASNAFALAAARQVVFREAGSKLQFNPLYLHAAVGCGKTHLLQAVATGAGQIHEGRNVLYLTAEHFMYRFVAALKNNTAIAFKDALRDIDIHRIRRASTGIGILALAVLAGCSNPAETEPRDSTIGVAPQAADAARGVPGARAWRIRATVAATPAGPPAGCLGYFDTVIEGHATHLGRVTGVGSTCITDQVAPDPDPPFLPGGPGPYATATFDVPLWTLTAANGDELWLSGIGSTAVISAIDQSLIAKGTQRIIGGTGRFEGATGMAWVGAVNEDGVGPDDFEGTGWIRY